MVNFLKEYFSIRPWQAYSIIALFSFVILITIANFFIPQLITYKSSTTEAILIEKAIAQISIDTIASKQYFSKEEPKDASHIHAFAFDPNSATKEQLLKLGLPEKTVNSMLNYRNKGGQFKTKADVEKMYTLSTIEYKALEPFIQLPISNNYSHDKPAYEKVIADINTSDTSVLVKLPGIGSATAQRIVEYRNKIGGYYSINQLAEVFGLNDKNLDMARAQLTCNKNKLIKYNINTVYFGDLSKHPYFKDVALAIVKYRKAKGAKIESIEELKTLPEIKPEIWEHIKHYLTL